MVIIIMSMIISSIIHAITSVHAAMFLSQLGSGGRLQPRASTRMESEHAGLAVGDAIEVFSNSRILAERLEDMSSRVRQRGF